MERRRDIGSGPLRSWPACVFGQLFAQRAFAGEGKKLTETPFHQYAGFHLLASSPTTATVLLATTPMPQGGGGGRSYSGTYKPHTPPNVSFPSTPTPSQSTYETHETSHTAIQSTRPKSRSSPPGGRKWAYSTAPTRPHGPQSTCSRRPAAKHHRDGQPGK